MGGGWLWGGRRFGLRRIQGTLWRVGERRWEGKVSESRGLTIL